MWGGVRRCEGWCGHVLKGRRSKGEMEPNKYD